MIRALGQHLLLSLRLNFRSRQPLIYGYVVPVFFLLAFGSVFRAGNPPLLAEMGQLLTITVLGGACFGMPTAMVNERERGVWRRYRLLPAASGGLVLSALVGRWILVASAAVLQVGLAWCFYRTPLPARGAELAVAFTAVCFAFLGLGLVIAMLADTVPAVQALGQAIFLPMIMIGGVGVPLRNLPEWAREVAAFFPGRYAVEALDACILPGGGGLGTAKFALGALAVAGVSGCAAGAGLFRWEGGQRLRLDAARWGWLALALVAGVSVGVSAEVVARRRVGAAAEASVAVRAGAAPVPTPRPLTGWRSVTAADLARIDFGGLPPDEGYVLPVAKNLAGLDEEGKKRLDEFQDKLAYWNPPGKTDGDPVQRIRDLLSVCSVADLAQDEAEGEIASVVFAEIRGRFSPEDLRKMLGWLILHPAEGRVMGRMDEFGIEASFGEEAVRERVVSYAKKLLLRLPPVAG